MIESRKGIKFLKKKNMIRGKIKKSCKTEPREQKHLRMFEEESKIEHTGKEPLQRV